MREFNYAKYQMTTIPNDVVNLLAQIYQFKGRQDLFIEQQPNRIKSLLKIAKIQSTEASNRIEGIYTSSSRLKKIVEDTTSPQNRDEQEIAGYRDVLDMIHNSSQYMPVAANTILQLHKNLYQYSSAAIAGKYKQIDNVIEQVDSSGNREVRFVPTPAIEVSESVDKLCHTYRLAIENGCEPLVVIFSFVFDFLSIHPFVDGNGRLSRLLTLLLMYQNGFVVGKYISIEKIVEKSKQAYYLTLQQSSVNWHTAQNDVFPFVRYMLGVLKEAYVDFEQRAVAVVTRKISKSEQIKQHFASQIGKITKSDLKQAYPDISEATIEKTLKEMLDAGQIQKQGSGRSIGYFRN